MLKHTCKPHIQEGRARPWVTYVCSVSQTVTATHHSSGNSIVKGKGEMPRLMALENAYIPFVENHIEET